MKKMKRILIICFSLIITLIILFFCIWHNEIISLASLKMLKDRDDSVKDGAVYTMHIKGGFYLEDFIEQGGVKNDNELLAFISDKVTKGLLDFKPDIPQIGCSAFTAEDKLGHKLFCRNYDLTKTNTCIVFTEGSGDRHATISTVDFGFMGISKEKNIETFGEKLISLASPYVPVDGINDAGVSCSVNVSYQGIVTVPTNQNTELPDVTSTMLVRIILDYADSVDEAVEIAKCYDMHDSANMSLHYMVADASGKSAVLQWIGETDATDDDGSKRSLRVIYNTQDNLVGKNESMFNNQVITNFILEPGYYANDLEKYGYDRYKEIWADLYSCNGIVENEKDAMNILATVGARNYYNDSGAITVHSVVYNLTNKSVLWIPNEHYDDENAYYYFELKK